MVGGRVGEKERKGKKKIWKEKREKKEKKESRKKQSREERRKKEGRVPSKTTCVK